jgi:hypothetical protein
MRTLIAILFVIMVGIAVRPADVGSGMRDVGREQDRSEVAAPPALEIPAVGSFIAVDVFVNSGGLPLAAYQIEIRADGRRAQIVGVEGGLHAAFSGPPYYDPEALHEDQEQERIVIAAFSTAEELPSGRTRVARLHLRAEEGVQFVTRVEAAGTRGGERIEVGVEIAAVSR